MTHICLTGFMGAGKSSVGTLVAERLTLPFVDLDRLIEEREGALVPDLFTARGEAGFRDAETAALTAVLAGPPAVIACGGGVVLRDENRAALRERATVVYLAVTAEEALARIGDAAGRPLLAGDAARLAPSILGARLSLYRASADVTVDTAGRNIEQVAAEVLAAIAGDAPVRVTVAADRPYDVVIARDALDTLGAHVAQATAARTVALVTDEHVAPLLLDHAGAVLASSGLRVHQFVVPAGEVAKRWQQAGALLEGLASAGLGRDSAVVALGGGVVGDLAGFVAATFARGVDLVQAPTTLLAQVDSSIGGKTAVDLVAGKNLAGAVWQPRVVVSDLSVLGTLPDAEWANGLAEVAKTALLAGEAETARLEADAARLRERDGHAVHDAVVMSVRFKAAVVGADEREAGPRECLNLGHTLAHALERVAGYGAVGHGVAVAEGLRVAAGLACELVGASTALGERTEALIAALGIPRLDRNGIDANDILDAMRVDKKVRDGEIRYVLLRAPGDWTVVPVATDVLLRHLNMWLDGSEG